MAVAVATCSKGLINVFQRGKFAECKRAQISKMVLFIIYERSGSWPLRIIFIRWHWRSIMTNSVEENNWLINLTNCKRSRNCPTMALR